jgi:hypothetical protein
VNDFDWNRNLEAYLALREALGSSNHAVRLLLQDFVNYLKQNQLTPPCGRRQRECLIPVPQPPSCRCGLRRIVCKLYGKSARRERNNKNYWWMGLKVALKSAPQKRTAP